MSLNNTRCQLFRFFCFGYVVTGCYWLLPAVTGCYWMLLLNKSREGSGLQFMQAKAAARHECHDGESVSLKMHFLQREEITILSPLLLIVVTSCYWLLLHVVTGCYRLLPVVTTLLLDQVGASADLIRSNCV